MKITSLRPWYLGLTLLAAICALAWLQARAQSPPPPAPKPVPAAPGTTPPVGGPPVMPVPGLDPSSVPPPAMPVVPKALPQGAAVGEMSKPPKRKKIARPVSAGAYFIQKMQSIILPEVQLQGASMEEALDLLRTKSRDLDTIEFDPAKKGVNIILKPDAEAMPITLSLKEVPMAEALKYITELGGMKYKIEPYAVVVIPHADWLGEMYTRTYEVPPNFLTSGTGGIEQTPQEVLQARGVMFPDGAIATYVPAASQLIIRNTQSNLDTTEVVVKALIDEWEKEPLPASPPSQAAGTPGMQGTGSPVPPPIRSTAAPSLAPPATGGSGFGTIAGVPAAVLPPNPMVAPAPRIAARAPSKWPPATARDGGIAFTGGGMISTNTIADPRSRVEQLLRDSEFKVLLRHYEATVAEIADAEKAGIYETDKPRQEALAVKVKGLREWKSRLEADIHKLIAAGASISAGTVDTYGMDVVGGQGKAPFLTEIPIIGGLFEMNDRGAPSGTMTTPVNELSVNPGSSGDAPNHPAGAFDREIGVSGTPSRLTAEEQLARTQAIVAKEAAAAKDARRKLKQREAEERAKANNQPKADIPGLPARPAPAAATPTPR